MSRWGLQTLLGGRRSHSNGELRHARVYTVQVTEKSICRDAGTLALVPSASGATLGTRPHAVTPRSVCSADPSPELQSNAPHCLTEPQGIHRPPPCSARPKPTAEPSLRTRGTCLHVLTGACSLCPAAQPIPDLPAFRLTTSKLETVGSASKTHPEARRCRRCPTSYPQSLLSLT